MVRATPYLSIGRGAPSIEEQTRIVIGILLSKRMAAAKRLFADGNRPTEQRRGVVSLAKLSKHERKIAEAQTSANAWRGSAGRVNLTTRNEMSA
jgi:hypothetical protein